ncbi:hypothetical protein B14911_02554 [Bacillus sp. NRRL B-14911]|nr:hypothetical protein B14911_02554 [Bacillus sp. NRRL B-14911]
MAVFKSHVPLGSFPDSIPFEGGFYEIGEQTGKSGKMQKKLLTECSFII